MSCEMIESAGNNGNEPFHFHLYILSTISKEDGSDCTSAGVGYYKMAGNGTEKQCGICSCLQESKTKELQMEAQSETTGFQHNKNEVQSVTKRWVTEWSGA